MNKIIAVAFLMIVSVVAIAQKSTLYNPEANAKMDIENALKKAKAEHKFVLLQAGGNWCPWCIEFHRFCSTDKQIDSIINANFVWYHLNYSKENKNEALLAKYGFPQRFGFPVFIVLNTKGERIHTQSSEYLEDGKKSYDQKKVMGFLTAWTPNALDAKTYQ